MSDLKRNRKITRLSLFALVIVCVLLNFLGARLNEALGLPFFIDNIGTILAALLGGYIPCITVGFLSNIFNAISSPDSIYYCVISVFIATMASLYAEKLRRLSIPFILLAVPTFAFLGGVVGGILTWLIYGMDFGEGVAVDIAASIDQKTSMGYLPSNLISCFLIDLVDKAIVTAIALLIYKIIPKKLTGYFKERKWYNISVFEGYERKLRKRFSMRIKMTLLVGVSTALVAAAAIATSVIQYHDSSVQEFTKQRLLQIINLG